MEVKSQFHVQHNFFSLIKSRIPNLTWKKTFFISNWILMDLINFRRPDREERKVFDSRNDTRSEKWTSFKMNKLVEARKQEADGRQSSCW